MNDLRDGFPIGMRVLAVDDDKTYLKDLETLLLSCQYHVTTAHNAITALMLLRENKDNYDLVMTKDHMPDMDGFKLLEHVTNEMDIPVIMFSANYDQKMVMQGIVHGVSDYLSTPIRIQELQVIWQHVIIKKKNNKTSNQFFWTDDLHRKFVATVNQLVADKAEPNKILDLMNVENLTREIVASHLKKYRQYAKRVCSLSGSTQFLSNNFGSSHNNPFLLESNHDTPNSDCGKGKDSTAQKKPRVLWPVDLHRKFIAAVNQLGIDEVEPKKIHEMMNVENLTWEDVEIHLKKYRLTLKNGGYLSDST